MNLSRRNKREKNALRNEEKKRLILAAPILRGCESEQRFTNQELRSYLGSSNKSLRSRSCHEIKTVSSDVKVHKLTSVKSYFFKIRSQIAKVRPNLCLIKLSNR